MLRIYWIKLEFAGGNVRSRQVLQSKLEHPMNMLALWSQAGKMDMAGRAERQARWLPQPHPEGWRQLQKALLL